MDETLFNIDQAPVDAYVNGDMNGGDPTAPGVDGRDPIDGSAPLDGGGPLGDPAAASDGINSGPTDTGTRHALPNPGDATTADGVPLDQFPPPRASQPTDANVASGATDAGVPTSQFPAPRGGSFNLPEPSVTAAANGAPGFSADGTTPNAPNPGGQTFSRRLGNTPDSLPNPGGQPSASAPAPNAPTGSGSGSGQGADANWAQDFQKANGYYNPTFDSREAFLHEAQMGDTAIRGATGGGDQLAKMAQYDSDAKRIYDAVQGTPDFYKSQMAADWAKTHNQSVTDQYGQASGQGGGQPQAAQGAAAGGQGYNGRGVAIVDHVNQAVATGNRGQLDWLKSQLVNEVANPIKNTDAFPVAAEIVKDLQTLGVDGTTIHLDNAGTLHFTSVSGMPNSFPGDVPLADWVNDLATLKNAIAQRQQPAPQAPGGGGGGGGYPPRTSTARTSVPRATGGGGGSAPPAAAPNPVATQGYGPGEPTVSYGNRNVPEWQVPYLDQGGTGGGRLGFNPNYGAPTGVVGPDGRPIDVGQQTPGGRAAIYT